MNIYIHVISSNVANTIYYSGCHCRNDMIQDTMAQGESLV